MSNREEQNICTIYVDSNGKSKCSRDHTQCMTFIYIIFVSIEDGNLGDKP